MQIRALTESDAEALWQLRDTALQSDPEAFAEPLAHHRGKPVSLFAERLRSTTNVVFGAFDGTRLIGMAGLYKDRAQPDAPWMGIWGMFVMRDHRGVGIGRGLIEAALAHARTMDGIGEVRLEVAATQQAARNLYLSCGFRPAGVGEHGGEGMALRLGEAG